MIKVLRGVLMGLTLFLIVSLSGAIMGWELLTRLFLLGLSIACIRGCITYIIVQVNTPMSWLTVAVSRGTALVLRLKESIPLLTTRIRAAVVKLPGLVGMRLTGMFSRMTTLFGQTLARIRPSRKGKGIFTNSQRFFCLLLAVFLLCGNVYGATSIPDTSNVEIDSENQETDDSDISVTALYPDVSSARLSFSLSGGSLRYSIFLPFKSVATVNNASSGSFTGYGPTVSFSNGSSSVSSSYSLFSSSFASSTYSGAYMTVSNSSSNTVNGNYLYSKTLDSVQMEQGGTVRTSGSIRLYSYFAVVVASSQANTSTFYPNALNLLLFNGDSVVAQTSMIKNSDGSFSFREDTLDIPVGGFNRFEVRGARDFSVGYSETTSTLTYSGSGNFTCSAKFVVFVNDALIFVPMSQDEVNTGLLQSIIDFIKNIATNVSQLPQKLQSVVDNIGNVFNKLGDIFASLGELPGKILEVIINAVKSLFVPTEAELADWQKKYEALISDRLGGVYQSTTLLGDFFDSVSQVITNGGAIETIDFPGIAVPMPDGTKVVIVEPQPVTIKNKVTETLQPYAAIIITIISALPALLSLEKLLFCIIGGKTYYDFLVTAINEQELIKESYRPGSRYIKS